MPTPSTKRTTKQNERIASATSVGYAWKWDSEYQLKFGRGRYAPKVTACLVIMSGRVTGSERGMIIYPDGSAETKDWNNGRIKFSRAKLADAMRAMADIRPFDIAAAHRDGASFKDEDEHFMEGQQR